MSARDHDGRGRGVLATVGIWAAIVAAPCAPVVAPAAELSGLAALAGTPGGGAFALRVTSVRERRFLATVQQQYDFSCGSAAVATLLTHHYNLPVSEQQAFQEMFARGDQARIRSHGFSLLDMKNFLATRGLRADGFLQPLDSLGQAGFPAIVLVAEAGYHHFVVVKGLRPDRVLLGDPAGGTRAISRAAFEAVWQNRLLFVIHDAPRRPRFNDVADWNAAPASRPADVLERGSLARVTLPKLDAGDF
jgi:predicted double-glycine peptidase